MCIVVYRRQEEIGGDFESKTEISLSCQLMIAGKKTIYSIYIPYISGYILYIYTQGLSLFNPNLSKAFHRIRVNGREKETLGVSTV